MSAAGRRAAVALTGTAGALRSSNLSRDRLIIIDTGEVEVLGPAFDERLYDLSLRLVGKGKDWSSNFSTEIFVVIHDAS
jgi:hypothetical protein